MAAAPEVISYLQQNLKKFPVEELRKQLAEEGVSEVDFDEALAIALRTPAPKEAKAPSSARANIGRIFLISGMAAVFASAVLFLKAKDKPSGTPPETRSVAPGESAYVGFYGYVVRLPQGYTAVQRFKDQQKSVEVVHFCKTGTDPTNFLNDGLYGQLGIVRLEAEPSAFASDLNGLETLSRMVTSRAQQRGEKHTLKNLQVSSLRGIQINYDIPFPRVEAYVLGQKTLYTFFAGQDDEVYRDIIMSLRDAHTEM